MADIQHSMHLCAQARQYLKSAKAMKGSKSLVTKAIDLYEQVLAEHGQELPEPYFGLGYIAYAGGRPDLAIPFLQTGLQLAPGHEKMRALLQRAHRAVQKQAETRAEQAAAKPVETAAQAEASQPELEASASNPLVSDLGPEQSDKISRGPEVEMLQRALQKLGHTVLLTSVFDRATYTAVRSIQSLYKLPVTGLVDGPTRERLNPVVRVVLAEQASLERLLELTRSYAGAIGRDLNEFQRLMCAELAELLLTILQEYPTEVEETLKTPDEPFPAREPLRSRLGNMGQMGIVSKGEEVRRMQQVLNQLGYPVKINEQFDMQTFSELSRFQLEQKLPISGIVEGPTRDRLNELLQPIFNDEAMHESLLTEARTLQQELALNKWPTIEKRREALTSVLIEMIKSGRLPEIPPEIAPFFQLHAELGPSNRPGKISQGREVRLLQQALRKLGYGKIEVNGSYDNETYAAVRSVQISKKLPMTGMVDAKTREELNELIFHVLTKSEG
jgi:peptidoglycan hydrolase-like protein with peptidoglycan-binding domain